MIVEVKNSRDKIVPHSDHRVGTAKTISLKVRRKRIATRNVRSLEVCGKLENVKLEMERLKIDVLGISEIRWTGQGDYRVIFKGDERKIAGVGIILNKVLGNRINTIIHYSKRIIAIKIESKQLDIFIIQVYMPMSSHMDEKIEEMYKQISELAKEKNNLIILGDWNAIVGVDSERDVTGKFGLEKLNQRCDQLIKFCMEKYTIVTNTV